MPISPITEIIDEIHRGRMVVLMDDEDRENEGDLLMAAAHALPRTSTSWRASAAALSA